MLNARFIPTRVGNSLSTAHHTPILSVHPHAGGELSARNVFVLINPGSSPRGWGTHKTNLPDQLFLRFIPTRVGNSAKKMTTINALSVHPHAGGELFLRDIRYCLNSGSSPRGWGTHKMNKEQLTQKRFIPTRVGNSIVLS